MLLHIAHSLSNREIAQVMFLSEATVKTHVNHLLAKTALRTRAELVRYAYQKKLAHS